MKFKVGDPVRRKGMANGYVKVGNCGVIIRDDGTDSCPYEVKWDNGNKSYNDPEYLELINDNNMELKITKKKVLEAASKCSQAKGTLEVLFPEAFESEDNLAIKKGALDSSKNKDLMAFSETAFGSTMALQVLHGYASKPEYVGRGLLLLDGSVQVNRVGYSCTEIIFFKK